MHTIKIIEFLTHTFVLWQKIHDLLGQPSYIHYNTYGETERLTINGPNHENTLQGKTQTNLLSHKNTL